MFDPWSEVTLFSEEGNLNLGGSFKIFWVALDLKWRWNERAGFRLSSGNSFSVTESVRGIPFLISPAAVGPG